ncbi:MAG: hypothetical protein CM15mV90_350 [uncultured marine virus]|nr:MAG: hypothetical protein CM15mV90_350 [uncultured marine virus]
MGIAMKSIASGTSDVVGGAFSILGAKIKEFANKALVQIGRIPILGRAIDTAAAKRRIKEAAKSLDEAEARIRKGRDTFQQQALRDATFFARFAEEQKGAAQRVEIKKQQKKLKRYRRKWMRKLKRKKKNVPTT